MVKYVKAMHLSDIDINGLTYKEAVQNTKRASKINGYDYALVLDTDGSYTITRVYENNPTIDNGKVLGVATISYDRGIPFIYWEEKTVVDNDNGGQH